MRSSLSQLYFECARISPPPLAWIGGSLAVHLGIVLLPVGPLQPSPQTIAFPPGNAGAVQVELIAEDAPVTEPKLENAPRLPIMESVAQIPPLPPILPPDEIIFAEPVPRPQARVSRKSPTFSATGTPPQKNRLQASRAGSAAVQPVAQLYTSQPPYPPNARESGAEGIVRLRVRVGTDGFPREVEIARSSGRSDFDRASISTVTREWRFRAARGARGAPVESTVLVTIRFELNS